MTSVHRRGSDGVIYPARPVFPASGRRVTMRVGRIVRRLRLGNASHGVPLQGRHHEKSNRLDFLPCGRADFSGHVRVRAQVVDKPQEDSKAIKVMVEDRSAGTRCSATRTPPTRWRPARLALAERNTRDARIGRRVVLWAHKGRPEASASIFPFEGSIHHEFVSLSRGSKLVAPKPAS